MYDLCTHVTINIPCDVPCFSIFLMRNMTVHANKYLFVKIARVEQNHLGQRLHDNVWVPDHESDGALGAICCESCAQVCKHLCGCYLFCCAFRRPWAACRVQVEVARQFATGVHVFHVLQCTNHTVVVHECILHAHV